MFHHLHSLWAKLNQCFHRVVWNSILAYAKSCKKKMQINRNIQELLDVGWWLTYIIWLSISETWCLGVLNWELVYRNPNSNKTGSRGLHGTPYHLLKFGQLFPQWMLSQHTLFLLFNWLWITINTRVGHDLQW